MENFKRIAVLMGGTSNEREVSLESGSNVVKALESLGLFEVIPFRLDSDSLDGLPAVDAAFLALHGGWGENGGVQAALDALCIPYTGPDSKASKIAMDKIATKRALDAAGVPNAPWAIVTDESLAVSPIGYPCVVKPPRDGSSVGIAKVSSQNEWSKALREAIRIDRENENTAGSGEALVEKFIAGREMTVGILNGTPLPVVEIVAPGGWYGYEEKYLSNETRYPFPKDDFLPEVREMAVAAYNAVGCRGVTRVDFRIDCDNKPYVLELNTLPGMTAHSLVPKACAEIGLDFPHMCLEILKAAAYDGVGK